MSLHMLQKQTTQQTSEEPIRHHSASYYFKAIFLTLSKTNQIYRIPIKVVLGKF